MKRQLLTAAASLAVIAGCATVEELPAEPRLATLRASPPDYAAFDRRADRDARTARSIDGVDSIEVARATYDKGWTLIRDQKAEDALLALQRQLVPSDFQDKFPELTMRVTADYEGLGAQALNIGMIIFEGGILRETKHYDEINFVVAHELSHLLLDHYRSDELAGNVALGLTTSMILQGRDPRNPDHLIPLDANGRLDKAALATLGVAALSNAVYERRKVAQEKEADQLALELMLGLKAYNSPLGGQNFLDLLIKAFSDGIEKEKGNIERNRLQLVAECGERAGSGKKFLGDLIASNLAVVTQELSPECEAFQLGELPSKAHLVELEQSLAPIVVRRALIERYWDEKLRGDATAFPALTKIVDDRDQPVSYIRRVSPNGNLLRLDEVRAVEDLLKEGRCEAAQQRARRALRGEGDAFAPLRYAYFEADKACGHPDAGRHLLIAGRAGTAAPDNLLLAMSYYRERNDLEKALTALDLAAEVHPVANSLLPLRIELRMRLGHTEEAEVLLEECLALRREDRAYTAGCRASAKIKPPTEETDSSGETEAEEDVLSYENRSETVASMRYTVIATAMSDPELSGLLPRQGGYTFYVPTDDALAVFVGGDPRALLQPANRESLKKIIRSHIVYESGSFLTDLAADSAYDQYNVPITINENFDPSEFNRASNEAAGRLLEQYFVKENATFIPLNFDSENGAAVLTDRVAIIEE